MKALLRVTLLLLVLGAVGTAGLWQAWNRFLETPAVIGNAPITVEIERGQSATGLIDHLQDEGLIVRSPFWKPWLRTAGLASCLQAGTHHVVPESPPAALRDALCRPTRASGIRVTIPEGRNVWQVAAILEGVGLGDAETFTHLAFDADFLALLGVNSESLEGRLFPDTWEFAEDASAERILTRMHERFTAVWERLLEDESEAFAHIAQRWRLAPEEVLILASLVETEAVVEEERPRIARVFYNRIDRAMRLQTDPTCVYGEDRWHERPSPARCRDRESRFSTYVIDGLPPTPIAAVGLSSLRATLHPSDEPDILFFVAMRDGTGRHAFSQTLAEHNRNIDRYLRRGR